MNKPIFTPEEKQYIAENCNILTIDELCALHPGKTRIQVVKCSYKLGRKPTHDFNQKHTKERVMPESIKEWLLGEEMRDERVIW